MKAEPNNKPDRPVPADFPCPVYLGALPGTQPKIAAVLHDGKFYLPGCTPPEIRERWLNCCDLAQQLALRAQESKAGKHSHMSEQAILQGYLERLIKTGWTSEEEAKWVIHKAASMLEWPTLDR